MGIIKNQTKWEQTKKEFKEDLKNPRIWVYFGGLIFSAIIFSFERMRMIGLIGIIVSQLIYNLENTSKKTDILGWAYFIIFILYAIIYHSLKIKDIEIAIITIILLFLGILIGSVTQHYSHLKRSKTTPTIIISYIGFSFSIIVLFGFFFAMVGGIEGQSILNNNGEKIMNPWGYVGFSTANFYSTNFGKIPNGVSELISYIELAISYILHIIILGRLINSRERNFRNV